VLYRRISKLLHSPITLRVGEQNLKIEDGVHMDRAKAFISLNRISLKLKFMLLGIVGLTLIFTILHVPMSKASHTQTSDATSLRTNLIGSWRLVSRESRLSNGDVVVDPGLSGKPSGILIYDQSGHVAAQLSRPGRTVEIIRQECQAAAEMKGTPDTAQTVFGYDAYFGTYTIKESEGKVIHHLDAALFPGDIGKDIERSFTISGDQLTISFITTTKEGARVKRVLIWERLR
jgi:hypothetical protein